MHGFSFMGEADARAIFDIGKSTFRQRIADGLLPGPVKFGARSLWPRHELDAVAGAVIGGASDDDLRALVAQIVEARKANATRAAA